MTSTRGSEELKATFTEPNFYSKAVEIAFTVPSRGAVVSSWIK